MVKQLKISFLALVIASIYQSCCYWGPKTIYGVYRISPDKFHIPIDTLQAPPPGIDTSSVYLYYGEYSTKFKTQYFFRDTVGFNNYSDTISKKKYSFLKFYANGKFMSNSILGTLKKEDFNPLDASMGFYAKVGDEYVTEGFYYGQCGGRFSKYYLEIYQDSIVEVFDDYEKRDYRMVYVKRKVPKEWLVYKPDW